MNANTQRLTLITAIIVALAIVGIIIYSRFQPSTTTATTTPTNGELSYDDQPRLHCAGLMRLFWRCFICGSA